MLTKEKKFSKKIFMDRILKKVFFQNNFFLILWGDDIGKYPQVPLENIK